jgi:DNA replication protein DnaC
MITCPFTKLETGLPGLLRQAHLYARGRSKDKSAYDQLGGLIYEHRLPTPTEAQKPAHAKIKRRLERLRALRWMKSASLRRSNFEWSQRDDIPVIYRDPADIRLLNRAAITGEEIDPLEYKLTNPAKLPDATAYEIALTAAEDSDGGIILWGPTGAGKSRALYAAARIASRCELIEVVSPAEIKRAATKADAWDTLRERLLDAEVVVIDDLSHARFSEAYAASLLELVESATANRRPRLFVTVQCTGSALVRKWAGNNPDLVETAQAIARRLGEFLQPIEFRSAPRR